MATITFTGTGGIIEGNLGPAAVDVNLEPALQFGLDASGDIGAVHRITQTGFTHHNRDISFSCWYKAQAPYTTSPSRTALFSMVNGTDSYRTLWFGIEGNDDNPDFRGYIGDGSSYDQPDVVTITDEQVETWNHYAVTISSGNTNSYTVKLYINGVLKATDTSHSQSYDSTARAPQVGDSGYRDLDGLIKDWRCYGTELDIDDIKILASKMNVSNDLLADSAELQLHYKLDGTDISSTTVTNAGNASSSNGTLNSTTGIVTHYDEFSVDVQDNSTTTDGNFTVTQGKVEGKALTSYDFSSDALNVAYDTHGFASANDFAAQSITMAAWIKPEANGAMGIIGFAGLNGSGGKSIALGLDEDRDDALSLAVTFVDNNSSYGNPQNVGVNASATLSQNQWHHVAVTYTGGGATTLGNFNFYIDGVLFETGKATGTTSIYNHSPSFMGNSVVVGKCGGAPTVGKLRDVKAYDYVLSEEEIASLYSNTNPVTPNKLWYKFDATSGVTDESTANIGAANASFLPDAKYHNGTLDLDGTLTIEANGTLSMPRGELEVSGTLDINCTTVANQIIHNNGTLSVIPIAAGLNLNTGGATFYNVHRTSGDSEWVYQQENCTILKRLYLNDYVGWGINGASTLTLGDSDTQCTVDGSQPLQVTAANGKIYGGDQLKPALIQCTGGITFSANTNLKWIDVQVAETTGGSSVTVTLDGDCEFDAVTVSSGDTLDLNSQRAEFGGNFSLTGTLSDTGNAGIAIFKGTYTRSGTKADLNTGTVFMIEGAGSSDYHDPVPDKFFVNAGSGTVTLGNPLEVAGSGTADVILGSGTLNANNQNITGRDDITIATGGTYTAGSGTITCKGDFTTSGGLLGASCLDINASTSSQEHYSTVSAVAVGTNAAWTIEGWIKRDNGSTGNSVFVELRVDGSNANRVFVNVDTDDIQFLVWSNGGSGGEIATVGAGLNDGKWHHIACTYDSTTAQVFIDGKLSAQGDINKTMDNTDDRIINVGANVGTYDNEFLGAMDDIRIWDDVRTPTEIRSNMFNEVSTGDGLVQYWKFNEGTGDTANATVGTSLNARVGGNSASSQSASLWAGAGTFTQGTSTLVMAKSGTQTFTYNTGGEDVNNLTVNDGSTTNLKCLQDTGGVLDIFGNLVVNEKLGVTVNEQIKIKTGDKTITIGSDVKTSAVADLFSIQLDHTSGNINIPELTTKRITCRASSATTTATGDLTLTSELEVNSGATFNANGNTITTREADINGSGGTLDLRNSTLSLAYSSAALRFEDNCVLLSGNSTITGLSSASKAFLRCPAAMGAELVGTLKFMNAEGGGTSTSTDITVIGPVIDCSFADSTANIRQWHHTLDTQQLLDADEAGDDDLRLTKPALDNALELMTK